MSRSDSERLADILAACGRLTEIVELGRAEFDRNWLVVSAASYELSIVGEAMANLSDEFLDTHSTVPARSAKSLRNLLMHEYFRAESDIVWDTITTEIPVVVELLRSISAAAADGGYT
ncbi:DUF86 domain-containing protein [Candidatus Poriferisodalis sp.]|uniref:HepT-like ribonuclease domain-containing protein n=1 Tax=Candidatus Poriferisodalis sp. TaxID=3101277 RepID=UPI003B02105C